MSDSGSSALHGVNPHYTFFKKIPDWIIENDLCQVLGMVFDIFAKQRGFGLFFAA